MEEGTEERTKNESRWHYFGPFARPSSFQAPNCSGSFYPHGIEHSLPTPAPVWLPVACRLAGCSLQRKPFRRGRWRWSASCTLKGPGASCSAGAARGEALRLHRRKERRHDPTNQMAPTRRAGSRGEGVENPKTRGILPKESGNSSETTPRRMLSNRIQIW